MKEAYYMDASKSYQSIVDFHFTKPHQYKPLIDIWLNTTLGTLLIPYNTSK